MPVCLEQLFPLGGTEMNYCATALSEWWSRGIESGSTWIALAVIFAGFGGLVFGWLIGRPSAAERKEVAESDNYPLAEAALRWRHEKLILTERQQREAGERVSRFSEFLREKPANPSLGYAASLFSLTEAVREGRQTVGTDFSRLKMVGEQLSIIQAQEGAPRPDTIDACQGMAVKQVENLVQSREVLKGVSTLVLPLEEELLSGKEFTSESVLQAREVLGEAKILAGTLSPGWEVASAETDRQIGDSLKAGKEAEFDSIASILLVYGSVSSSLASDRSRALSLRIQETLDELGSAFLETPAEEVSETDHSNGELPKEEPPARKEVSVDEGFKPAMGLLGSAAKSWENPFLDLAPDDGFRAPASIGEVDASASKDTAPIQLPLKKTARVSGFRDLTKERPDQVPEVTSAESEPVSEGSDSDHLVLFRSNDVGIWGETVYRGANCRARSLEVIPDWAEWISMERLDTRERVFVRMDGASFDTLDDSTSIGFNASNELFYGARHLGFFSEACSNEVETRFTYGGWGFGHRLSPGGSSAESLQAVGWEGKEIPSDTIFEICLHRELPEQGVQDRVLNQG